MFTLTTESKLILKNNVQECYANTGIWDRLNLSSYILWIKMQRSTHTCEGHTDLGLVAVTGLSMQTHTQRTPWHCFRKHVLPSPVWFPSLTNTTPYSAGDWALDTEDLVRCSQSPGQSSPLWHSLHLHSWSLTISNVLQQRRKTHVNINVTSLHISRSSQYQTKENCMLLCQRLRYIVFNTLLLQFSCLKSKHNVKETYGSHHLLRCPACHIK